MALTDAALSRARALSHPMRVSLLRLLEDGPATSAQAARALSTHTGATSFHLRQLARHGMVEPDPRTGGRERPWRLVADRASGPDGDMDDDEERRYRAWHARRDGFPAEWARHAAAGYLLWLTPAERDRLAETLLEAVVPFFERDRESLSRPDGARPVRVLTRVFPDFDPSAGG